MNYRQFILALAAISIGLPMLASEAKYSVTIPAPSDSEGALAYMLNYDTGETMDSVVITGATMTFTGTIAEPIWVRITVDGDRAGSFILEPGTLVMGRDGLVDGGKLNTEFAEFNKFYQGLATRMRALPNTLASRAEAETIQREFEVEKNR
ncbi:MAG: DUF4369 domain-containing protein, partial [Muribaculaceae bacterium]|nr:DUF4369 domain-containing protein [Muribaculaceae bacterium]